jgi:flagellar hook protein FlgE
MASFSIPLTGLEADTTALNTIANNLSNMSTTSYKAQNVSFSDLFYQQIGDTGSGDPIQTGAGTQVSSIATDYTQGSINSTGTSTDVAIDGDGYFIVQNNGATEYTRDGGFSLTTEGGLTTSSGGSVMGYPATNGVVDTNAPLSPIVIPVGAVEQPNPTTSISMTANLDSAAAVGTVVPDQITVYDSQGTSYTATVTYTKTATNTWSYGITLTNANGTAAATSSTGNTGTLTFDANGNLLTPAANVTGINFSGLSDGAANLSLNWNLYPTAGGASTVTQVASASTMATSDQNGYASGEYQSFMVNSDGSISVSFNNGQSTLVGQVALATVANQQGLSRVGGNNYVTTLASGTASVGVAGAGGRGTLESGSLEQSNVNVSTEFSDLIVAQQAYEANSKAITTFDQVSQDTINMIH